ncbi:FAD-binding oxidoreductase [Reyranella sp.]|uniref:NAD(P)/FAD-dependent oxidoreductase n=1 Tax=Reyranella sp. TaxID=1929291 RepID=UPI002731EA9F|nr:FAD-binding oxidoreductase [Reyranella sp.]MDP2376381.1 FAD-binding oxidoreductase [Reyranella sp.]
MANRPHVLIVGAGIIGASIAWHLASAGARVTVVDAGAPGGVATRNSWAWINASWGNPEAYFRLRVRAMAEWRRLERELPDIRVAWVGGLIWELPPDQLEAFAVEHLARGYGIRRVDRVEAQRIEPQLAAPPEFALHVPGEGAVEPLDAVQALLTAAQGLGATVIANNPVRALNLRGGRVRGVRMDIGDLDADEVILAAGAGTAALAATAGLILPITAPPALLVATKPEARLLNGLVMAPELQMRQTAAGRLLATAGLDVTASCEDGSLAAAAVFEAMKRMLRSGVSLDMDFHAVGRRPIPKDGLPVIGRADGIAGLYIAVMHSGITLAPAVGRFVTDEILSGRCDPLLAPYGVERFAGFNPHGA